MGSSAVKDAAVPSASAGGLSRSWGRAITIGTPLAVGVSALLLGPLLKSILLGTVWRHVYYAIAYASICGGLVVGARRIGVLWRRTALLLASGVLILASVGHVLVAVGMSDFYRGVTEARAGRLLEAERLFQLNRSRFQSAPVMLTDGVRLGCGGIVTDSELTSLLVLANAALERREDRIALDYYRAARDVADARGDRAAADQLQEQIEWIAGIEQRSPDSD